MNHLARIMWCFLALVWRSASISHKAKIIPDARNKIAPDLGASLLEHEQVQSNKVQLTTNEAMRKVGELWRAKGVLYQMRTPSDAKAIALQGNADEKSDGKQEAQNKRTGGSRPDIIFVLRTWSANYNTKVKAVLDTWGAGLNRDLFIIVGDTENSELGIVGTTCGSDHSVGLACRDSVGLELAGKRMEQYPSVGWVFMADDDLYVRTSSLAQVLQSANPEAPVAFGVPDCGPDQNYCGFHDGGFCGGSGYAISRAGMTLVASGAGILREEIENTTRDTGASNGYDDVATTCVLKRHGVQISDMDEIHRVSTQDPSLDEDEREKINRISGYGGLHYWRLTDLEMQQAIKNESLVPLTFHYLSPEQLFTVHSSFATLDDTHDPSTINALWKNSTKPTKRGAARGGVPGDAGRQGGTLEYYANVMRGT